MRLAYRILAYTISTLIALQAAAIGLAFFGLTSWVAGGGTFDKSFFDSNTAHFSGDGGLGFHAIVGFLVIPVLALLLVVSSFFTKVRGALTWALVVLGSVIVQIALAALGQSVYWLGALHGLFAFAVLAFATVAATRVARAGAVDRQTGAVADSAADVG
jgi:hypothetical protein